MFETLQVSKREVQEAIRTLQRARENIKSEGDGVLHREFVEEGIGALTRISGDNAMTPLPSWTITKWEVDRDVQVSHDVEHEASRLTLVFICQMDVGYEEQIGVGFFSKVYRGTWKGRTVAIKVLSPNTPPKSFVHEVEIWKELRHDNVLELLGASSTTADPPYFLVSPYLQHGAV